MSLGGDRRHSAKGSRSLVLVDGEVGDNVPSPERTPYKSPGATFFPIAPTMPVQFNTSSREKVPNVGEQDIGKKRGGLGHDEVV